MTSFAVQYPPVKGTIGNRMDKSVEKTKNNVACAAKVTGTAAATLAATVFPLSKIVSFMGDPKTYKNPAWNRMINNYFKVFAKKLINKGNKIWDTGWKKHIASINKHRVKYGKVGIVRQLIHEAKFGLVAALSQGLALPGRILASIARVPAPQKVLASILGLGGIAIAKIVKNHSYKAGQIDQKYTDRAQLQKTL